MAKRTHKKDIEHIIPRDVTRFSAMCRKAPAFKHKNIPRGGSNRPDYLEEYHHDDNDGIEECETWEDECVPSCEGTGIGEVRDNSIISGMGNDDEAGVGDNKTKRFQEVGNGISTEAWGECKTD